MKYESKKKNKMTVCKKKSGPPSISTYILQLQRKLIKISFKCVTEPKKNKNERDPITNRNKLATLTAVSS